MRSLAPIAAALALFAGCRALDPMQDQQKVRPYRKSGFYANGLTMRDPPAGAVSQSVALDPVVATGLGPDGLPVKAIPIPVTAALLETGRKRFDIVCATCHGRLGDGQSVVARKMSLRAPPSLHDFRDRPDGFFYQVVTQGYGLMPSYVLQLPLEERWAVVAYVRALQLSQHAPLQQAPAAERARLQKESP